MGLRRRASFEDECARPCAFKSDQAAVAAARVKSTESTSACGPPPSLYRTPKVRLRILWHVGRRADSSFSSTRAQASVRCLISRLAHRIAVRSIRHSRWTAIHVQTWRLRGFSPYRAHDRRQRYVSFHCGSYDGADSNSSSSRCASDYRCRRILQQALLAAPCLCSRAGTRRYPRSWRVGTHRFPARGSTMFRASRAATRECSHVGTARRRPQRRERRVRVRGEVRAMGAYYDDGEFASARGVRSTLCSRACVRLYVDEVRV